MKRRMAIWKRKIRRLIRPRPGSGERGVTMIELAIMSLIVTIALVAMTEAIQNASRGSMMVKEKSRAMALARDRIEEVKNMGYTQLTLRVSNYVYPDIPDPDQPLYQSKTAMPYPAVAPSVPDEDPWTPEIILMGGIEYWRHVKVKFVRESGPGGALVYQPDGTGDEIAGTGYDSNLALIEVDVTWYSRRSGRTEQLRLTSLVANAAISAFTSGSLSGSLYDDDCAGVGCTANGTDEGAADDKYITGFELIVAARNLTTGQTYTTLSSKGKYVFDKILPNGSYLVELRGGSSHRDSGYTGVSNPVGTLTPAIPVDLTPGDSEKKNINIWTTHLGTFSIRGTFMGVNASPSATHYVTVSANDGLSTPVTYPVTTICDGTSPCAYVLPNVAWPSDGTKLYTLRIVDENTGAVATSELCVDSTATMGDFHVGEDPAGSNPCGGTGGICSGLGWIECVNPPPTPPLDLVSSGTTPASVRVKVWEYFNNASGLLDAVNRPLARVVLTSAGGLTATLMLDSDGTTTFHDLAEGIVPVGPAGDINIRVFMTTTGWSQDSYTLPFPTDSNQSYDLEIGSSNPKPDPEDKHTFVMQRVSEICGTIWAIPDADGFDGASLSIRNNITEWAATLKCDDNGVFSHTAIPVETGSYTIAPVVGSDYVSTPAERTVFVGVNGVIYLTDSNNERIEFTLNAVNAHISGKVYKGAVGNPVASGAVVIASTYSGAFPTTLPSGLLGGEYSYSTVTLTDGSYRLRVATGVGSYFMYAYMMRDGVLSKVEQVGPVNVTPSSEKTQDVIIP